MTRLSVEKLTTKMQQRGSQDTDKKNYYSIEIALIG